MRHNLRRVQLIIISIFVLITSVSSVRAITQDILRGAGSGNGPARTPQTEAIVQPLAISDDPNLTCYKTIEEIYALADTWATEKSQFVEWVDIGDSWNKTQEPGSGFDIKVLILTNEAVNENKPILLLMSGLHARELAPVELNLRFAEYLLENYGEDADVTWLLDYREIHFLFVANPDGYEVVMNTGASWKKNTNNNYCTDTDLRGADLFRNFPFQWEPFSDTCSDIYPGIETPKEPETAAIINHLLEHFPDQRDGDGPAPSDTQNLFIDIHSYGEVIYWPYSYTSNPAPNHEQLKNLAYRLAYYKEYRPLQVSETPQFSIKGTPFDYVYGELGVAAYIIEVGSDMDGGYFTFCDALEESIFSKNIDSLVYSAKVADAPYRTPFGPNITNLDVTVMEENDNLSLIITAGVTDTQYYGYINPTQDISSVRYSIDTPIWKTTEVNTIPQPKDGAYDTPEEEIEIIISGDHLEYGRHILFMQGQDTTGQWGPVSAVFFEYQEPPPVEEDTLIFLPLIFK